MWPNLPFPNPFKFIKGPEAPSSKQSFFYISSGTVYTSVLQLYYNLIIVFRTVYYMYSGWYLFPHVWELTCLIPSITIPCMYRTHVWCKITRNLPIEYVEYARVFLFSTWERLSAQDKWWMMNTDPWAKPMKPVLLYYNCSQIIPLVQ